MLVSGIVENKGTEVVAIDHEASCSSLIALLESYNIGAAIVVSEGEHIVGIISERDIVRAIAKPKRSINCMVFAQSSARHNC